MGFTYVIKYRKNNAAFNAMKLIVKILQNYENMLIGTLNVCKDESKGLKKSRKYHIYLPAMFTYSFNKW